MFESMLRRRARSAPSPACGRGVGRGQASRFVQGHPLPNPPPQAGEGTHRIRRASNAQRLRAVALIMLTLATTPALAQSPVADFYRGKQIKFIIRASPGGGFDLYSR